MHEQCTEPEGSQDCRDVFGMACVVEYASRKTGQVQWSSRALANVVMVQAGTSTHTRSVEDFVRPLHSASATEDICEFAAPVSRLLAHGGRSQ